MTTKTDEATCRLNVKVASDKMKAVVTLTSTDEPDPVTEDEVIAVLKAAKIAVDESVLQRISKFVHPAEGEEKKPESFVAAEGKPPVEGQDGSFEWHESFEKEAQSWQGDAPINYYTLNSMITVDEGQVLGTIKAAIPGINGRDVFSEVIKPSQRPTEVEVDRTVRLAEDGSAVVYADSAGKVVYEGGKLWIDEVLTVKGDVDFECGNITSPVDVHITGTINDLFCVESQKSISIGGAVEAAVIRAGKDVCVRGGILGRHKGKVNADGEIVARFCIEADMESIGDIKIAKELMNCRVKCQSTILVSHGSIIGGQVYAREGVEAATLGSEACIPTEVMVGMDPETVRKAHIIEEAVKSKREACERIRETIKPLLADQKRLTADQKERATELLFKADGIAAEIEEDEDRRQTMMESARAKGVPFVLFSKCVYPETSIRIGRRQTIFHEVVKGPLKIEKRKVKNVTEFVAINQLTGSIIVLPSAYVVDKEPEEPSDGTQEGTGAHDG